MKKILILSVAAIFAITLAMLNSVRADGEAKPMPSKTDKTKKTDETKKTDKNKETELDATLDTQKFEFKVIEDIDKFKKSAAKITKPEQAVLHLFNALWMIEKKGPKTAYKFLKLVLLHESYFYKNGNPNTTCKYLINQLDKRPKILRSYLGTEMPDYQVSDSSKFEITFLPAKTQKFEKLKRWKIFVQSSGKDFPTPITLKKVGKTWKIAEFSSICTGVKSKKKNKR